MQIYEAGWVERNWEYPPTIGENRYVGPVAGFSPPASAQNFDPAQHNTNNTFTFPVRNVARTAETANPTRYWWFGKLGNGTQIAEGRYVMRFAALKPFGNPYAADNWEVYRTPTFEVTGQPEGNRTLKF